MLIDGSVEKNEGEGGGREGGMGIWGGPTYAQGSVLASYEVLHQLEHDTEAKTDELFVFLARKWNQREGKEGGSCRKGGRQVGRQGGREREASGGWRHLKRLVSTPWGLVSTVAIKRTSAERGVLTEMSVPHTIIGEVLSAFLTTTCIAWVRLLKQHPLIWQNVLLRGGLVL